MGRHRRHPFTLKAARILLLSSRITMDSSLLPKSLLFFTLFLFITTTIAAGAKDPGHPLPRPPSKERMTRLRFYWQDVLSGKHPTSITIVQSPSAPNSSIAFGHVQMIDNLLTEGLEMTSKQVGRCQGIYASAQQQGLAVFMAMNVVFTEGRYNGSTLTIVGRNPALDKVRELPVIGGTCVFRMARGYAIIRTRRINGLDGTVQYNVVVVHQ